MSKRTTFPCPVCKGTFIIEPGHTVDGEQVTADIECYSCDDGFITIGSEKHHEIQMFSWMDKAPAFLWGYSSSFSEVLRTALDWQIKKETDRLEAINHNS